MTPRVLSWIAQVTSGRLHGVDRTVDAVTTDTRALPQGRDALFVALKGENFDGHDHVAAATAGGCVAALVSRVVETSIAQVVVADTQHALADFAAAVQRGRSRTRVVAITGSNGKTSVKTLIEAVLSRAGKTYATPGNRNNEIGMPLAVLDAPDDADFAIYEMGTGAPGDIAYLTAIAAPDVGLVNNVAPAHLERMGSLLEIANTKAAVYDDLRDSGTAVINADDAFAPYFAERAGSHRVIHFGLDASAEVSARDIEIDAEGSRFTLVTPQGRAALMLAMPGLHNVRNALAATAVALALDVPLAVIVEGLQAARPVGGRQVAHRLYNGAMLVDDSYNANPGSVAAAIDILAASGSEAWLVLGDMRELGVDEVTLHAQAGARAKAAGIARLYTLGALSKAAADAFGDGARAYASHAELADALSAELRAGVRVLVKGSRGSAMDRIVKALLASDAAADKGEADAA
ncbi:UDP-N-acetylmuramoyl-tripeptide--D-alanyl-D-alanine ligase [Thermomonas sp. HDW16]|uniref:UDP-N-acetylmuramoyl-tripeptide--D-alanyl-D- alanine ligase n=1 Tax=Thermomonas sp. HDW16 TaxID=2714945 RepID=UPI00140DD813|nr:UDP-N-acetylmuramoyl-tripeptide--D-alanyl-D-alanine ligase [Thermomonas sp. HDW16]QIL21450.1 UDP-N-acetylmuramoyl-tripeptide--D-alanyl-D-alanine ligase [Thermomonas sp. HDW16]